MSRAKPVDALLAGLATLLVTLPMIGLLTPTAAWARPSLVLVLAVALAGVGLRALTSLRPLVVVGQLVVLLEGVALIHGQGHLWNGLLPVPETGRAVGILLGDAYTTISTYTVPAPADRGVVLAVSLLVGLTAVAVDAVGVTYRSPAAAGVPLLTAFLAGATNTTAGLAAWLVIPPGLAWLALVGRQGVRSLRAWGGSVATGTEQPSDATSSYATSGRIVGVLALAAAAVLPGVIPHLPPTFVAQGLARGESGTGGGAVRLSTSIDIARDLAEQSDSPVLVYRTSDPDPEPLRVGLLDTYRRGQWRAASGVTFVPIDGRLPGPSANSDVTRSTQRIEVSKTAIGIPQVALPENAVGTPFPAGSWRVTGSGLVELTAPVEQYTVEYERLTPNPAQFLGSVSPSSALEGDLRVDPRSETAVRTLLGEITTADQTPLERAVAIQDHLRSSEYTYSEELADDAAAGTAQEEPLARFLQTKRGYCVQFASAMIMLSRASGIPARMAVGFLPGSIDGEDRVVRANDAHAWPELYFPQLGWMRFEPTPGVRTGPAPDYTVENAGPAASEAPTPTPSVSASASAPDRQLEDVPATGQDVGDTASTGVFDQVGRHLGVLLAVLGVLLLGALTPAGAWWARRRARRRARTDAERVEAEWQTLMLRFGDLGLLPGDGSTPRRASQELGRAAYLTGEEDAALGRVVGTLERARYARPGSELPDVAPDATTVWKAALGRRRRLDRARAVLLPEEGLRWWRSLLPRRSGATDEDTHRD